VTTFANAEQQISSESSLGNAKGTHELDAALWRVKALGYTKGS
jgi:hypothetical protein